MADEAQAGRLQVRLLRRLPAVAARLRGRAAGGGRAVEIAYLPGGLPRVHRRARTTWRWSKVPITTPTTRSGSRRSAAQSKFLVTIGACATAGRHPGPAQLGGRRRVHPGTSTPTRSTSRRWRQPRRSPTTCSSISSCAAARSTSTSWWNWSPPSCTAASRTSPPTASASSASGGAPSCVMVAPGHPLPGAGHAGRLRRPLPGVQPRLLRLLRPDGDAQHAVRWPSGGSPWEWTTAPWCNALRSFNGYAEPFREASDVYAHASLNTGHQRRLPRPRGGRGRPEGRSGTERSEITEFGIFEPPRFFEAFLRGRQFREVPDITARICGICPVAYQMSSCTPWSRSSG